MTVILIDAKNCLYRFGWVHRNLRTEDGIATGAVYGFISKLVELKKKYEDAKFVVVWDGERSGTHSWRSKLYPQYKANRHQTEMPREIKEAMGQIGLVKQAMDVIGISQIELEEVEADDLIGILTMCCAVRNWKPIIYSSDDDFLQLVCKGVTVIRNGTEPVTYQRIQEKFRCKPEDLLKVRAICGDKSDNIAGAQRGVGVVTAARLVATNNYEMSVRRWPTIKVNYQLMEIILNIDDERLPPTVKPSIKHLLTMLVNGQKRDYNKMLEFLGNLELEQAISDRLIVWSLAK